ncbi:MAG: hypothetical protein Q8Q31_00115 [Nanoarchaeota archaeon]|nr:hypothetical protein [Nanoarchaeota archaeon]
MAEEKPNQEVSKEELIGYHKGSINTLISERNELLKIVQITEQLIRAHVKELETLGVNINPAESPGANNPNNSQ